MKLTLRVFVNHFVWRGGSQTEEFYTTFVDGYEQSKREIDNVPTSGLFQVGCDFFDTRITRIEDLFQGDPVR